jgi:hypothetical protein
MNKNKTAIHLVLQFKGGVGKSLIASFLAQYFMNRDRTVYCIDADPVNHTLSQYKGLNAQRLQLLHNHDIKVRGFDEVFDNVMKYDGVFVVDSSASVSLPLWAYLQEIDVPEFLQEAGRRMYVHTVVAGGQSYASTVAGLEKVAGHTTLENLVVWINEYFGAAKWNEETLSQLSDGARRKILGAIRLPSRNKASAIIERMISGNQTFDEAIRTGRPSTKQLLKNVQHDLFEQLDRLRTDLKLREESVA